MAEQPNDPRPVTDAERLAMARQLYGDAVEPAGSTEHELFFGLGDGRIHVASLRPIDHACLLARRIADLERQLNPQPHVAPPLPDDPRARYDALNALAENEEREMWRHEHDSKECWTRWRAYQDEAIALEKELGITAESIEGINPASLVIADTLVKAACKGPVKRQLPDGTWEEV